MSNKTHGQPETTKNLSSRILLVVTAVVLLIVLVAATLFNTNGDEESSGAAATARQAALASEHSPTMGDPDAKVHIVEFLDPACGTCAMFYPMVKEWMNEVPGQIRLSVRHAAFHNGVDYVVRLLEASRNQDRYWETLEALLAAQQQWVTNHVVQPERVGQVIAGVGLDMAQLEADMNSAEVLERVEKDRQDAITLRVTATPEYFVNSRPLPSFGREQLADLIREELEE